VKKLVKKGNIFLPKIHYGDRLNHCRTLKGTPESFPFKCARQPGRFLGFEKI